VIAPVATVVRLPKSHDAVQHCCFPGVDLSRHTARGSGLEFPIRYDSVTIVPLSRRAQLLAPSIGVGHLPGPSDRFPPSARGQPPGFATPQGRCLQGGSPPRCPGAVPGRAMVASCQCQAAPRVQQEPVRYDGVTLVEWLRAAGAVRPSPLQGGGRTARTPVGRPVTAPVTNRRRHPSSRQPSWEPSSTSARAAPSATFRPYGAAPAAICSAGG
jgi:hypothetical protein